MKRNPKVYVDDMLDSVARLEQYTAGVTYDEFSRNGQLQDAIVRRLEIIGEVARQIPEEIRQKHDAVPWKQIAGMRDILIHEYFNVNLHRVWQVLVVDLPVLKRELHKIQDTLQ
jgi:uncharacterized protein with HEPN domain